MAKVRTKNELSINELLARARQRVELPTGNLWVEYEADVDLLYIRFKERPQPTHSQDDLDQGIIRNYEGKTLVSLEVLDITGLYAQ
jgi:hypothetical protein